MKTRSQTRAETKVKSTARDGKIKKNKRIEKNHKIRECVVRLDRLNSHQIANLIEPQTKDLITVETLNKKYALRNRVKLTNERPIKEKKPLLQIVAMSQAALYTAKAIRIWDQIRKQAVKDKVQLNANQIVCARMSGHRPWPARVVSFEKNGISLKFYGTNETGIVKKGEVLPYDICKDMLDEFLKVPIENLCNRTFNYHMLFVKAAREVSCIKS